VNCIEMMNAVFCNKTP